MENNYRSFFSKIANYSFYTGVIIEVLLVLIDKSAYTNPIEGQIFRITFLLFLVKIVFTRYSLKEYMAIFLFCALGVVSYCATGRNEVIRIIIFIAASKDIDMKKCLKAVFYMTLAGCIVIMFLSVTGIYGAVSLTRDYGRGSIETRYVLGMGHPNALQCMVWAVTVLGLYLYGEKMKWFQYGLVLLLNIGFFLLTDSKTSFLVTFFAIGMAFLAAKWRYIRGQKFIAGAGIFATVGSVGISVVIAANAYRIYDYVWHFDRSPITLLFFRLNEILNGRIRILVENNRFEGTVQTWSLFSRPENNYFFDMGWVRLFYWFGVIPGIVFVAFVIWFLIYCYRKKDYMAITLTAALAVYNIAEAHIISDYLARNYLFFLLGGAWCGMLKEVGRNKKKNERRKGQNA
ncbi:hypothetical protein [Parablautia intestinalis]|nr:hypothetical protein [Parablautia intestinalis]